MARVDGLATGEPPKLSPLPWLVVRVAGLEVTGGTLCVAGSTRFVSVARVLDLEAVALKPADPGRAFSVNMFLVWVVAFFVASFIALEVTAGGGTPSLEICVEAWVWYDGGGVPLFAAAKSLFPGVGIDREAASREFEVTDPGAGVEMPW